MEGTDAPTPRPSLPRATVKPADDDVDNTGSSDSGRRRERDASESAIIVICVTAAVLVVAALYVWNKLAQAKKQPHRDSSMPALGEDVEGVAEARANWGNRLSSERPSKSAPSNPPLRIDRAPSKLGCGEAARLGRGERVAGGPTTQAPRTAADRSAAPSAHTT